MRRYAQETTVSSERSKAEIERTLRRYGASAFAYGANRKEAVVSFVAHERQVRFRLEMPDPEDREFTRTPRRGTPRSPEACERAYEQVVRQRWRALALVIKAKLEAVTTGITTFEEEFLAHIALPDGSMVADLAIPQIAEAYRRGTGTLRMLPDFSTGRVIEGVIVPP